MSNDKYYVYILSSNTFKKLSNSKKNIVLESSSPSYSVCVTGIGEEMGWWICW